MQKIMFARFSATQKRTLAALLAFGLIYFTLFIAANTQGARDPSMLSVFEVDEYAQYPHVIQMLTPGVSFYQSVRNFFVYLHYFYGYPFYFFSALALLPIKLVLGSSWSTQTVILVTALRQLINVAPMAAAAALLVYMQTKFASLGRSVILFALLLALPAVVVNNLWWHPDSMGVLFCTLVLFFLQRDDQRFGRNFYFAAAACGIAAGIKYLGVFFFLAIPVYLIWGVFHKQIAVAKALLKGLIFTGVMLAVFVLTNPLLLLPQERAEIVATQKLQFSQTSVGILMSNQDTYFHWNQYPQDFRTHYGELIFVVLCLAGVATGIRGSRQPWFSMLILAWIVPLVFTFNSSATRRTHYFLPVMLPLVICLWNLIPESLPASPAGKSWKEMLGKTAPWMVMAVVAAQMVIFLGTDFSITREAARRELTSASIAFYEKVNTQIPPGITDKTLVVYRDWRIYFPPKPGRDVEINWDFATLPYLDQLKPDLVLLEKENLDLFSKPDTVAKAANPGNMAAVHALYLDASQDRLTGYRQFFSDRFASAYIRENLLPLLNRSSS